MLIRRITRLQTDIEQVYGMASLGLTAEALSHEIRNIADHLAERTRRVADHIQAFHGRDRHLITYIEHVRTAVGALRKQLAHLEPSLRYVRERRERVDVFDYLEQLQEFHGSRLADAAIDLCIEGARDRQFGLLINPGKLTQIMDNLILNSEYWLKEDLRIGVISRGRIAFEVARPRLSVWDNGRGVDPVVEHTLFEPFVTTKKRELGRGLGLFIVRQLLDSEGSRIELRPVRNGNGRLFVFDIDFTGALDGESRPEADHQSPA